ncbi:MAG TPA: HAMP domain-containing sensor histidine kinase [Amycolatopsis sp.]|uniref:sensor histidine kinase n=1 Tax=Amycolatopsis sp. TaxID=37632 RepID=UPI002B486ACB|nr:HAMP domain-containing sensor histidine kinase [Amycolatopsis sp.]HKS46158.1 HAMP domain-containing sensor histidine kinase [Amycolatopsis sp.]
MNAILTLHERRAAPDVGRRELTRAQRTIGWRIAVVMSVIMLLTGSVVFFLVLYCQRAEAERETQWAIEHNTVASPPVCVWMFVERQGVVTTTPGAPAGVVVESSLRAVRDGAPPILERAERNGDHFTVRTARRGDEVVQAAYNERFQDSARANLLLAFGAAELIGLVLVAVASGMLVRSTMTPLCDALNRQQRFVADASHELRTPLTQLHTRAQLLARRVSATTSPEQLSADLQRLVVGTRQLGDVIDDLLLSAKLSRSSGPRDPVDLGELAVQAAAAEDARAEAAGVTISVRQGPGRLLVIGVAPALRRVLAALIDNALGHTPPGGEITVSVTAEIPGTVRLTVGDNGVGFAPGTAEHLFERFARGDGGRGQRFGLGLALVREVIENHHGRISAEGRLGEGARFTAVLPAAKRVDTVPRQQCGPLPGGKHSAGSRGGMQLAAE